MTERERLIELLNKKYDHFCDQCGINKDSHYTDSLADYLLSNGVIVLPCKAGQTLYFLYDRTFANRPDFTPYIYQTNDWYFDVDQKGISILPRNIHSYKGKCHYYLGETVFLTKEETEEELCKILHNSLCETETYEVDE